MRQRLLRGEQLVRTPFPVGPECCVCLLPKPPRESDHVAPGGTAAHLFPPQLGPSGQEIGGGVGLTVMHRSFLSWVRHWARSLGEAYGQGHGHSLHQPGTTPDLVPRNWGGVRDGFIPS